MLRTRYEKEASNYFLDNGELTFDLHVEIEGLVFSNGIPLQGRHYLSDDTHVWVILGHIVVYRIEGNWLTVEVVMPT